MSGGLGALRAFPIDTPRLQLSPLRPADADDLFAVLDDRSLHRFTGGRPDSIDELRSRIGGWASERSPDGSQAWLNWIVRIGSRGDLEPGLAIGTMQATVTMSPVEVGSVDVAPSAAEVAWVIGAEFQERGFASEAARALVRWLAEAGAMRIEAHIHPEHAASEGVARAAGFQPTDERVGGEVVWRLTVAAASGAG
jgi:RimJ/RimL family protein N-acetyltransferase